ncbi:MAG: SDR family oxidoreductase [Gemmatimonadetes bacterium]|nr:SDR family oxidoreductase [Gemmatimonadota bacterium]
MSRIADYYAGKAVFVTGATGLVGRVLVEKLLRDVPQVRRLYLLIRPKGRKVGRLRSVEERLDGDFLASSLFDTLRRQKGDAFLPFIHQKVVAVEGDLGRERLGLSEDWYRTLQEDVQIIVNCAAVVKFDAPLDAALELNALGPLRLLELARGCKHPVILVHVSTCYVSGARAGVVAEAPLDHGRSVASSGETHARPYDVDREVLALKAVIAGIEARSRRPWRRWLFRWQAGRLRARRGQDGDGRAAGHERVRHEWVERRLCAAGIRRSRCHGWSDTYTFTKAMGEQLLARHHGDIPILVLRPSIVESTLEQPVPGWLTGMRMADPIVIAYGRGLVTEFPGDARVVLDIIPVDMLVNTLLAAVPRAHRPGGPSVYQVATGSENPILLGTFSDLVSERYREDSLQTWDGPPRALPWFRWLPPGPFLRRLRYRLAWLGALELLPAGMAWTPWGERMRSALRSRRAALARLHRYAALLIPYTTLPCRYLSANTRQLWEGLDPQDRADFNFDVMSIDWARYVRDTHITGLKRYVLKLAPRADQPTPVSRRRHGSTASIATSASPTIAPST